MAKRQRHTPEQIISKLREAEVKLAKGVATAINLTAAQVTTIGADQFNNIPRGGDYTPPAPSCTAPDPSSTTP